MRLHVGFEIDERRRALVAPPGSAVQERGVHGGRRDRVHAHPRGGLDRERAREPEDARLRGRIGPEAGGRADREARRGVHDRGRVALREQRERGAAREPGRAQVAGDDFVPVFRARVGERDPFAREAGEVHQAVERLPPARDLRERGCDRLLVGGVERDRERRARRRVPLDRGGQIQHRDFEAVGERRRDERAADAAAATGHDEPRPGWRAEAGGGRGCGGAGHEAQTGGDYR